MTCSVLNQNKQTKRSTRVVIRNIQLSSFLYSYPSTSPSIKKSNSLNKEHFDLALYSKIKKKKNRQRNKQQKLSIYGIFLFYPGLFALLFLTQSNRLMPHLNGKHIYSIFINLQILHVSWKMFYNSELYEINFYSMMKSSVVGN